MPTKTTEPAKTKAPTKKAGPAKANRPAKDAALTTKKRPTKTSGPVKTAAPGAQADAAVELLGAAPETEGRRKTPDALCAEAVDEARAAAEAEAGESELVGEHLGVSASGERLVVHRFACRLSGYPGWAWAVEVVRGSRAKRVTVNDVCLLPGLGALLAPDWLPWDQRLRPGDLGIGDILPTAADDERLALRSQDVDALSDDDVWFALGLGRPRVLSFVGRTEAAERWYEGNAGPEAALAKAAPAGCDSCGFLVRLVGGLGGSFGVCANEFAPDDGRVVAIDHGCGAHSEALVLAAGPAAGPTEWQTFEVDDSVQLVLGEGLNREDGEPGSAELDGTRHPAGSVDDVSAPESYGHS